VNPAPDVGGRYDQGQVSRECEREFQLPDTVWLPDGRAAHPEHLRWKDGTCVYPVLPRRPRCSRRTSPIGSSGLGRRRRCTGGDPAVLLSAFLWLLRVLRLHGSAASTAVYCFDSWPMQLRLRLLRLTAGSVGRAKWRRFARYRPPSFRRGEREATGLQKFSAQASLGPSRRSYHGKDLFV
jgi:hypothetical protein